MKLPTKSESQGRTEQVRAASGFTLTDLAVGLVVIALLAAVQFPSIAKTRAKDETGTCLYNHGRLIQAWLMYAEENRGRLPGNVDGGEAQNWSFSNRTWCVGWLDFTGRPDNTNVALLLNSQLGRYTRTPTVYKCPADRSLSRGTKGSPRVRSISMNGYMGQRTGPYSSGYRLFKIASEIVKPSPSQAFVFIDEREDSINDGWFPIDMGGFDPHEPSVYVHVDFPADWHNRGANLSFADGHTETWRWKDRRTMPTHRLGTLLPLGQPSPNNPDVGRLQAAATSKAQ